MAGEIDREMSSEQTLARWNANGLLEERGAAEPRRERGRGGLSGCCRKHTREGRGEEAHTHMHTHTQRGGGRKALG